MSKEGWLLSCWGVLTSAGAALRCVGSSGEWVAVHTSVPSAYGGRELGGAGRWQEVQGAVCEAKK